MIRGVSGLSVDYLTSPTVPHHSDDDDDDSDYGGVDRQLVMMGYRLLVRGCKGL